ncbi:hypothetical protein GCM10010347_62390 [Streptomyces cirratus]|uniref:Uncharacterized protein n=1 Tax=Streptomyces cirratus TaxID=68187 RepID=A0ABQ3F3Q5_9ACTN|nr:hypothetical protein GCM10010347_62390 [Streptomyces cirratus]
MALAAAALLPWARSRPPPPGRPVGDGQFVHDPEVSPLMTVVTQGAARTHKTVNDTSVASG